MNILKTAFELFVLYLLYKLVFGFIIPIYNTTKQMSGKVKEMQEKMSRQQQRDEDLQQTRQQTSANKVKDDYIDYEEVK